MPDSQPTIAELLAEFVVGLAYESIPAAVRERAKLHLLDSVGVAFAASGFEFARKACAGLAALGAGEYDVIGMPAKLPLRRRFTLQEMDADAFDDAEVRALAARVEYAIDPQSNFPAHYSGGVEISTADGRLLTAREDVNAGSAEKPLPASAIEEKFLANAQRVMPLQRAREIRDLLLKIDSSDDLGSITARLGAA